MGEYITNIDEFERAYAIGPCVRGYAVVFLLADGGWLRHNCVTENLELIREDTASGFPDGWRVVGFETIDNIEDDCCEHCGKFLND